MKVSLTCIKHPILVLPTESLVDCRLSLVSCCAMDQDMSSSNITSILKEMIEAIMSSYDKSECTDTMYSAYLSSYKAYYAALFDKNLSGDITIHKICFGTHTNSTNLLTEMVTVHVEKANTTCMGFGAVCFSYLVTGDIEFQFENCLR